MLISYELVIGIWEFFFLKYGLVQKTFEVEKDDDPKPMDFIILQFRVKFTLVFQYLRNQWLEFELVCLLGMV